MRTFVNVSFALYDKFNVSCFFSRREQRLGLRLLADKFSVSCAFFRYEQRVSLMLPLSVLSEMNNHFME